MINKAKRAITTGRFQNLQRDVNKMQSATKKTPIKPVIMLEQIIKLISEYPLEHISDMRSEKQTDKIKIQNNIMPEIIISESFNI